MPRCTEAHDAALATGLPVEWVDVVELPVGVLGAVRLAGQAHLDPGALCAGLADQLPGRVFERTPALDIDEQGDHVTVTIEGAELLADHVVVATLGPIHDPAMLATRCQAPWVAHDLIPSDGVPFIGPVGGDAARSARLK